MDRDKHEKREGRVDKRREIAPREKEEYSSANHEEDETEPINKEGGLSERGPGETASKRSPFDFLGQQS